MLLEYGDYECPYCGHSNLVQSDKTSLFIQRYVEGDFDMIILNRFKNVSAIGQIKMEGSER